MSRKNVKYGLKSPVAVSMVIALVTAGLLTVF